MDPIIEVLFERLYLTGSSSDGIITRTNSHALQVHGNTVVLHTTLIQASGFTATDGLTVQLEGSYNGGVWLTTGLDETSHIVTITGSGIALAAQSAPLRVESLDYAFLRARASVSGENAKALLAANVVFSHQT